MLNGPDWTGVEEVLNEETAVAEEGVEEWKLVQVECSEHKLLVSLQAAYKYGKIVGRVGGLEYNEISSKKLKELVGVKDARDWLCC